LAAKEDHHGVRFGGNETEEEDILGTTVVTFEDCIAERRSWVKLDFLVPRADKVIDNVRRGGVATRAAKPLVAS